MLLYSAWLTDMFRDHQTTASPYQGSYEDAIPVPVSLATSSFSCIILYFVWKTCTQRTGFADACMRFSGDHIL